MRISLLLVILCLALSGCYYVQAAKGQWEVIHKRESVEELIHDPDTPPELAARLRLMDEARDFSIAVLGLPDNKSYRTYTDLERDFVGDAVGGEGFANIGSVQFMQDSTLERYLGAAKLVAAHAVIDNGLNHGPEDVGVDRSPVERSAVNDDVAGLPREQRRIDAIGEQAAVDVAEPLEVGRYADPLVVGRVEDNEELVQD